MEMVKISLDDAKFDAAVHGTEGPPSLSESGDLAIYVKKNATKQGNAMAVVTFTVQLPDGTMRRAQATTTTTNLINTLSVLKGWKDGGHL